MNEDDRFQSDFAPTRPERREKEPFITRRSTAGRAIRVGLSIIALLVLFRIVWSMITSGDLFDRMPGNPPVAAFALCALIVLIPNVIMLVLRIVRSGRDRRSPQDWARRKER